MLARAVFGASNVNVLLWPQSAGVVASSAVGGDEIRLDPPKARLHLHSLKLNTPSTLSKHLLPNVNNSRLSGIHCSRCYIQSSGSCKEVTRLSSISV